VLLGGALSLASALHAYERGRQRIDPAFPAVRPPGVSGRAARAVDLLLLGVDDTAGGAAAAEAGMVTLLHLAGDRQAVHVLAIPHVTVVPTPEHGDRPIGRMLAQGGVPLIVQAVEHLLDLRLHHVSVLPLTGLAALTDALGGVPVDNGTAFMSDGIAFPAGRQRLDGAHAVAFVRSTGHGYAGRMDAERAYLRGLVELLVGRGRPPERETIAAIAADVFPRLATDPGLDGAAVVRLAVRFRGLRADAVHVHRLPVRQTPSGSGRTAVVPDPVALEALRRSLRNDALPPVGP
jgi:LCP family protein required for cell wall assembly